MTRRFIRGILASLCLTLPLALVGIVEPVHAQPSENPLARPSGEDPGIGRPPPPAPPRTETPARAAATDSPRPAPPPTASNANGATPYTTGAGAKAPKDRGAVFALRFGTSTLLYAATPWSSLTAAPALSGRFMVGYRWGRWTLGMGFEFTRTENRNAPADTKQFFNTVLFQPTVEVALLISYPLTLYTSLGFHTGFLATNGDGVTDDETPIVGFHGGLGIRFFMHPRFAIGMEGGFQGIWYVEDDDEITNGTVAFYGAFILTAIW